MLTFITYIALLTLVQSIQDVESAGNKSKREMDVMTQQAVYRVLGVSQP